LRKWPSQHLNETLQVRLIHGHGTGRSAVSPGRGCRSRPNCTTWSTADWTLCAGLGAIVVTYLLRVPMLAAILRGVAVTAALRLFL
jgi:hypothetical protein